MGLLPVAELRPTSDSIHELSFYTVTTTLMQRAAAVSPNESNFETSPSKSSAITAIRYPAEQTAGPGA